MTALRERIKRRHEMGITSEGVRNEVRADMLSMLLAHMDVYAAEFKRLKNRYGDNLPYSTGPEAAAKALFLYGIDTGILTEHNRPSFVRRWS